MHTFFIEADGISNESLWRRSTHVTHDLAKMKHFRKNETRHFCECNQQVSRFSQDLFYFRWLNITLWSKRMEIWARWIIRISIMLYFLPSKIKTGLSALKRSIHVKLPNIEWWKFLKLESLLVCAVSSNIFISSASNKRTFIYKTFFSGFRSFFILTVINRSTGDY